MHQHSARFFLRLNWTKVFTIRLFFFVCLSELMPSQREDVGIPSCWNGTRCLAQHQAATRTQAEWNSVCPRGTQVYAPPLVEPQV